MSNFSSADKSLNIIIVGCGKVGTTITEQLVKEGHNITVIDRKPKKIQALTNIYDIMGIVGNGASYNTQIEAGIDNADLFIAVTESDELNLLCCTVAKRVGHCSAIARVRNPDYGDEINYLREKLGLAMIINPELEAANEAARILYLPTALDVNIFAHGQAELIKFKIPEKNILAGRTITSLDRQLISKIVFCAVERGNELFIPSGNLKLLAGDAVSFVASRDDARKFLKDIGLATHHVRSTMIIGGGKAAYYLAKQLLDMGISVKIIESDRERCEELSILLPKAVIINGNGSSEDLLKEEGIEQIESLVALTGIDESNIMLTLHAKQVSNAKLITKINKINFKNVVSTLDLGSVIYPKYITSEAIIAYVRAKRASIGSNVETLYNLCDSRVEAIEFKVGEASPVIGIPLSQLPLKDNLLVACINRRGKIIIPSGNDHIAAHDDVMIVTTYTGFNDIKDILK